MCDDDINKKKQLPFCGSNQLLIEYKAVVGIL